MSKRPSYQHREARKLSFVCMDVYEGTSLLRVSAPSPEKWTIGKALKADSQCLTPSLPCLGGGQRSDRQVFASQPRGHRPFWCQVTHPFWIYYTPASVDLFSPGPASLKTPPSSFTSGRLLWLYDYIWGFVWLCMYLHHSQLVPINNRAPV